ncbi:MAG TPA: FHA domain-containing protein [Pseudomonadales bacterium]|nr:FHA domain-containing protein [Pseudomonadales bacterium]
MLKLRFTNKEHGDVWLVEPAVLLGTDSSCQVMLKRDGIQPRHIEVKIKGDELQLVNIANDPSLTVNGRAVDKQQALQIGDEMVLAGMTLTVIDPKTESKPAAAAAVAESSGWAIRPNHSALANKTYTINGDTVLGRSAECDLSFSVTHLSRKHAQLSIVRGNLMVKDLGSANGTYVNGKRVQESKLERGDELRLDTLSFTVIGPGGEADKTTLRAAVSIPSAAAPIRKEAAPAAPAVANESEAEKESRRVAGTTAFNRAVSASEEAKQEAAKPDGVNWIMVIIVLFAIAGVVAYYLLG